MGTFAYIFPFLFIGMWILVSYLLSRFGGWSELASKFEQVNPAYGKKIGLISAGVNRTNYSRCLMLTYNSEGFYLKTIFLFRLFHKPLFIPWKEIKEVRDKKILFYKFKEMVIGNPIIGVIMLSRSTYNKLEFPSV